jgi:hypothetical protein
MAKRLALQQLIARIERAEIGLVVVRDVARLLDGVEFIEAAKEADTLVPANERFYDFSTEKDTDEFIFSLETLIAAKENRARARIMMMAKIQMAREGEAVTGPVRLLVMSASRAVNGSRIPSLGSRKPSSGWSNSTRNFVPSGKLSSIYASTNSSSPAAKPWVGSATHMRCEGILRASD